MGFHLEIKENFEPISEGVHVAVCDKIIDLGEQVGSAEYGSKISHQAYVGWQVTDDGEDTKPIGKIYNISTDKKAALRKDMEAWLGKTFGPGDPFDSDDLLGKGCQLNIVHATTSEGKTVARVKGVMGLPKGMKVDPPAELFDFDLNENTWEALDSRIPEWVQKIIKRGLTYKQLSEPQTAEDVFKTEPFDGELPF